MPIDMWKPPHIMLGVYRTPTPRVLSGWAGIERKIHDSGMHNGIDLQGSWIAPPARRWVPTRFDTTHHAIKPKYLWG